MYKLFNFLRRSEHGKDKVITGDRCGRTLANGFLIKGNYATT